MKFLLPILFLFIPLLLHAQKIDSMFVHLYTDSLKKGTYNYINVDGKLKNGRYLPLDTSQVNFNTSGGKFYGNSLWLAPDFDKDKVTIKVVLKNDPKQEKTFDIYIKKADDPELQTEQEILDKMPKGKKGRRG